MVILDILIKWTYITLKFKFVFPINVFPEHVFALFLAVVPAYESDTNFVDESAILIFNLWEKSLITWRAMNCKQFMVNTME